MSRDIGDVDERMRMRFGRKKASEDTSEDVRMHAGAQEPTDATIQTGKKPRTHTRKQAQEVNVEELYEQLRDKRHLANLSFRYQSGELQELDAIYDELNKEKPGRMSKNDMARLALIMLCEDYRKSGDTSVLAQILIRM